MPNQDLNETAKLCYKEVLKLTNEEIEILRLMDKSRNHFLIKHSADSIIATLDLLDFVGLIKMLSADEVTLMAMEEIFNASAAGANNAPQIPATEVWVPSMLDLLQEIENDRAQEEKARQREIAVARRKKFAVAAPE